MFKGFREFVLRGNVIDLAVGRTAEDKASDEVRLLTEIRDRLPAR